MRKDKIKAFQTLTFVSIIIIITYFVLSLGFTVKNVPIEKQPKITDTGINQQTGAVEQRILASNQAPKVVAYTVVVTNSGAYLTIPYDGEISEIKYDPSVVVISTEKIGRSTMVEIIPKEYFTQSVVKIRFSNGRDVMLNLIGSFAPEVEITASTKNVTGILGDEKTVNLTFVNTGLAPKMVHIDVKSSQNVKVIPDSFDLYVRPKSVESVSFTVKFTQPGIGDIFFSTGDKMVFIPVKVEKPFEIIEYPKEILEGQNITMVISKRKACPLVIKYGDEILYSEVDETNGTETVEIKPPVTGVPMIPLVVSGCDYSENLLISVKRELDKPKPIIKITPIGTMVFAPGVYEMVVSNMGDAPANVTITVEHTDKINVTHEKSVFLTPGSFKVVKFNITTRKYFTAPEKVDITFRYDGRVEKTQITVKPVSPIRVNVSIKPITGEDGIKSAKITIDPNLPVADATVSYSVKILYNGMFLKIIDNIVSVDELTKTDIILPEWPETTVAIINVRITSGGEVIKSVSDAIAFKKRLN